ncbi:MAG TPA: nucleotidyltransferase [Actinomycetota bacterium]|jgi:hypothetical protein|nr:nucleotidyltransferase [Actinomycetota bacterium]
MSPVREDVVADALSDVIAVLNELDVGYLAIGGIATALRGIDKPVRDIDIFLREDDVPKVQEGLARRGFEAKDPEEDWLEKATRDDVLVDLIHRVDQRIEVTDEMIERGDTERVLGTELRVIGPEDLILSLAITDKPDTHYWKDALVVLGNSEIDWTYLERRTTEDPTRMLALLLHARAYDIEVPDHVLTNLVRRCPELQVHEDEGYLAARAKEALIHDERVGEPSLDITCEDGTIVVRGALPAEDRRRAVEDVLRERFPDAQVRNETTVAGGSEPADTERL